MKLSRTEETFLYHSFPRRFRNDPDREKIFAKIILHSVFESGLLLVPEQLTIARESGASTLLANTEIPNRQKRFCLTLLHEEELARHSEHFGHYSIAFSTGTARLLGAFPVIYVPAPSQESKGTPSADLAGHTLLRRMVEIHYLLSDLVEARHRPMKSLALLSALSYRERRQLREILRSLEGKIEPLEDLLGAMGAFFNFFYPTERADDARSILEELEYYYQREWRLCNGICLLNNRIDTALTLEEKGKLTDLDRDFFLKKLKYGSRSTARVDLCRYIRSFNGKQVFHAIDHVIAPKEHCDEIRSFVESLGFSGPVKSLDSSLRLERRDTSVAAVFVDPTARCWKFACSGDASGSRLQNPFIA